MSKIRTVVCGTSFGRFYIEGVKLSDDKYELVGILSTGSSQSKEIAERENVRLYTDVNDISKDDVDLACVVVRSNIVGGKGTELALAFLEKGIHVIQEQPVHFDDMRKCYMTAKKNNCHYFVEMFYSYLPVTNKFIEMANRLIEKTRPVYLEASCSLQVLLPLIDVIGRVLKGFTPWEIDENSLLNVGMFSQLSGKVKNIPCQIKIQNELNSDNPDNYVHLMQRITLYTESGSLGMTESHGEIIWNPRYLIPRDEKGVLDPYQSDDVLNIELSEVLKKEDNLDIRGLFEKEWPNTIRNYLNAHYSKIKSESDDKLLLQHNLIAAKYWNEIGRMIGTSRDVPEEKIVPIKMKDLLNTDSGEA